MSQSSVVPLPTCGLLSAARHLPDQGLPLILDERQQPLPLARHEPGRLLVGHRRASIGGPPETFDDDFWDAMINVLVSKGPSR